MKIYARKKITVLSMMLKLEETKFTTTEVQGGNTLQHRFPQMPAGGQALGKQLCVPSMADPGAVVGWDGSRRPD